ncbi:MAG: putative geopeptide radical SAM maturase [Deltaproteobacteria bacterium RIFOXYD12_FULL_57_12]|nr:MAG: putative geopeptide radical SAM maturase [Deltaproteobacteria bacterium RIFOXYD12_FULL_57_12]
MQLSSYLKSWPWPDNPEFRLLFSTKSAAIALVPQAMFSRLEQGLEIPAAQAENLAALGLLVADRQAERIATWNMPAELNRLNPALTVAVILGLACNFSCIYCYEGSMKDGRAMDDATAAQLVLFLMELYIKRQKRKLELDFYGGEPLLYPGRIMELAASLKPFIEAQGGRFAFSLVTNGSLLTPALVNKLLPLGLQSIKITVDGPAAVHDQQRPFVGGRPSHALILRNIAACCDLVKISGGGNFTRDNYLEFPKLLDQFLAMGLTPARLSLVKFDPAMQVADAFANHEFRAGCNTSSEPWVAAAFPFLRGEIMRRGFKTPKITPCNCMVDITDAMTVDHDGQRYKCPSLIGHAGYAAGNISQGLSEANGCRPQHWRQEEKCRACAYLPLCFGGCRYLQLQRNGTMDGVDCQQPFLDRALETLVRQDCGKG